MKILAYRRDGSWQYGGIRLHYAANTLQAPIYMNRKLAMQLRVNAKKLSIKFDVTVIFTNSNETFDRMWYGETVGRTA